MSEDAFSGKRKRSDNDGLECPSSGSAGHDSSDKWSEELHRSFAAAIYEAGVSQSSPSVLLENMTDPPEALTSERVKSHLQKYRKNKEKSKEEFMNDYDSFMRKAMTVGGAGANASHVVMPPSAMIEMMGGGKPSGGDIAAFLSYSVMTEGEAKNTPGTSISSIGIAKESQDYLKIFAGTHVPFPQLTEEEKLSPLGISMVYTMGLFSSLSQHMLQERRKRTRMQETVPQSNVSASVNNAHAMSTGADSGMVAVGTVINPHQQQVSSNSNNGMPWLSAADVTKQAPLLAQHIHNQHRAASGIASSNININSNHSGMPQQGHPPGNPAGSFYPILSNGDINHSKEASAHWGEPASRVPGLEGSSANADHARNPNSDSAQGSDSYAQV